MDINLMWGSNLIGTVKYEKIDKKLLQENPIKIDISKWPKVQNEIRCRCWYDEKSMCFTTTTCNSGRSQIIKVIIIVESPHANEFTDDFIPIKPLNGKSGTQFDNYICNKMAEWFKGIENKNAIYEIMIANPIQYQTSLFHFLNNQISFDKLSSWFLKNTNSTIIPQYNFEAKIRNRTWKALFKSPCTRCKYDFLIQIINYWPQYIVNCCTGGDKTNNWEKLSSIQEEPINGIKSYVHNSLTTYHDEIRELILYRKDYHPGVWK